MSSQVLQLTWSSQEIPVVQVLLRSSPGHQPPISLTSVQVLNEPQQDDDDDDDDDDNNDDRETIARGGAAVRSLDGHWT